MLGRVALLMIVVAGFALDAHSQRPNILLIMADDLGFSDLGCYGSEIETPHFDALAENGLRFTQFYNTGRCWPTRGSLMTGYYAQSIRRDAVPGLRKSGGRGERPDWAPLMCRPLKQAGYRTYHTGKWHIDGMPVASGFDHSYYLKDQHRFFNPTLHWKDDRKLPPVPKGTDFYATVALGDHVIETLQDHAANHASQPFFHYLAFAAPHFPLHALPADIDRYRQRYRVGWDKIRQQRWQRIQSQGIVTGGGLSEVMPDVGPPYHFADAMEKLGSAEVNRPLPWDQLTKEQQDFQSTKMAIHAAMIDCMDQQIGRVLDQIRAMNQFENTVVFFLSDNGASAEIMVRGDDHDRDAPMGSWASHLCLGPGWSTACNTPFRYHKTWVHEGGTATPLIVHWPAGIVTKGELRHSVGHVIDMWPTVMKLAGVKDQRHEPVRPGQSLTRVFDGDAGSVRTVWWLHEENSALRAGNDKISKTKAGDWELYDLSGDRAETKNLAAQQPEKLKSMIDQWNKMTKTHTKLATED